MPTTKEPVMRVSKKRKDVTRRRKLLGGASVKRSGKLKRPVGVPSNSSSDILEKINLMIVDRRSNEGAGVLISNNSMVQERHIL
jgi:hypothetical protein